jgi:hypothetical protein
MFPSSQGIESNAQRRENSLKRIGMGAINNELKIKNSK